MTSRFINYEAKWKTFLLKMSFIFTRSCQWLRTWPRFETEA